MSKVKVEPGQNVYDMAIQHYGEASAVLDFCQLNGLTLDSDLIIGAYYEIDSTAVKNARLVQFFADKQHIVATEDSFVIGEITLLSVRLVAIQNETNGGDGYAEVEAEGGQPPYNYYWSNGQTGPALQQASSGTYQVTVEDASGQITKLEVFIAAADNNIYLTDEEGNFIEDEDGNRIITE